MSKGMPPKEIIKRNKFLLQGEWLDFNGMNLLTKLETQERLGTC